MGIRSINCNVDDVPFDLAKRALEVLQPLHSEVVLPDLDGVAVGGYKLDRVFPEESDVRATLVWLVTGRLEDLALALFHVPEDQLVAVLRSAN